MSQSLKALLVEICRKRIVYEISDFVHEKKI